jgi:hypothetical protein
LSARTISASRTGTEASPSAHDPLVTLGISNSLSSLSAVDHFAYLGNGVDKLHLGLHVEWGPGWRSLESYLSAMKVRAHNTDGVSASWGMAGAFILLPRGLGRRYSFHVKHPLIGDVFITNAPAPPGFPNVMCWVDNRALSSLGVKGVAIAIRNVVAGMGGRVLSMVPSRVDLFADFHITGGLTLDFLQSKRVGKKQKVRPVLDGDVLETYSLGREGGDITARIYDKSKQMKLHTETQWTHSLWNACPGVDVWRVEFQLLRPALHAWGVESVDDVVSRASGLWSYLTHEWLTFRNDDNRHKSRRSIDPWWQAVQAVAVRFGPVLNLKRKIKGMSLPSKQSYVRLIAGLLPGYAARIGRGDPKGALSALAKDLTAYYRQHDFPAKYSAKRVALGIPDAPEASNSAA